MPLPSVRMHAQVLPAELYKAIYNYVLSRPSVSELTVEDPAETFEDLRDRNDLRMLLANEQLMQEGFCEEAVSHGGGKVRKTKARARATPMGTRSGTVKGKGKMGPPV